MIRSWLIPLLAGLVSLAQAQKNIDSTAAAKLPNELIIRMGYASRVAYAGRTLGLDQFGLSPSLAYYHASGLFGSVSGSTYSGTEPHYALTTFSAGYTKDITQKLSATLTYDYLYFTPSQPAQPNPLHNGIDTYLNYDLGVLNLSADYTHYWGQQTANQFSAMVSGFAVIRPGGWLDKIVLMPTLSALWGSDNVVFSQLRTTPVTKRKKASTETVTENESGLLDYELNLPIRIYKNNFRFLATYHYVIPHQLSANEGVLKPIGYLTTSFSYVFKGRH